MARKALLQFRRDTAANWTSANPVLAAGEPGWESNTDKLKFGDGVTAWNSLPYFAGTSITQPTGTGFWHSTSGTLDAATALVTEADLSLTNVTTANVNTSRHGFAPILPNDATQYLDGTGAYSVPPGGAASVTVATTVAGLGSTSSGKVGFIRAGSSPYEFVMLVYDSTYGHWVSPPIHHQAIQPNSSFGTNSTSYVGITDAATGAQRVIVPNYLDLVNAGLTLQMFLASQLGLSASTGSQTAFQRISLFEFNSGDTSLTSVGNGPEITQTGTATFSKYTSSGWVAVTFSPSPARSNLVAQLAMKVSASATCTAGVTNIGYRWVA